MRSSPRWIHCLPTALSLSLLLHQPATIFAQSGVQEVPARDVSSGTSSAGGTKPAAGDAKSDAKPAAPTAGVTTPRSVTPAATPSGPSVQVVSPSEPSGAPPSSPNISSPNISSAGSSAGTSPSFTFSGSGSATTAGGMPADAPARMTPADELKFRDELLWQRTLAKWQEAASKARTAVSEQRFAEARELAAMGLQLVEAARSYAHPELRYTEARQMAVQLQDEVAAAAETQERSDADKERQEIAERQAKREELLERQKAEKIEQLFSSAAQLRTERRFGEAAEVLRQILFIAPDNAKARDQLDVTEDYESLMDQKEWQRDVFKQSRKALVKAEEALIPWDYEILYPKNWLELTSRRNTAGIAAGGLQEEDTELNRRLKDEFPTEVRFEDQPFDSVMDYIADFTKTNITVDWEDLDAQGIERDKRVTVRLAGVKFATVLNEILTQVGGDVKIGYAVGDGLLRIATKEKLDRDKLVLVYDIRDLLVVVPRFSGRASLDPSQALQQAGQGGGVGLQGGAGGGGGGGGGGGQIFQGQQDDEPDDQGGAGAEAIIDIIRQTVEPDSWRETGGGDASIRELNGQLIVYNTSDAHRQVQDLLSQLRETRALQIAVECRFLNVTSNFLEQFGIDLDFVFNQGSAGFDQAFNAGQPVVDPFTGSPVLIPRQFSQIGNLPNSPGFGTPLVPGAVPDQPYTQAGLVPFGTGVVPQISNVTPIGAQQGSFALTSPNQIVTGVPGSFTGPAAVTPALNIAGSFLDNLQVDFLIRATQANGRSSIVQAPRLILFNGQRARVTVGRVSDYVASIQPLLAEAAVGLQPIILPANQGSELIVDGTISADRRYVTMTVTAQQSDQPLLREFTISRGSGNSPGVFVQLRDQSFATVRTTVSVPDGGTVLLGGLKQVGEVELDAGVPVLSKIPVLKRAFSNSTTVKDTRTLLILIKAKIIIQKEAEEEAFPSFSAGGAG